MYTYLLTPIVSDNPITGEPITFDAGTPVSLLDDKATTPVVIINENGQKYSVEVKYNQIVSFDSKLDMAGI